MLEEIYESEKDIYRVFELNEHIFTLQQENVCSYLLFAAS